MDFKNLNKRSIEDDNGKIDAEKIKTSELYKEKGNELFKKQQYDDALDYYFKSITLNPTDHRCYGNIGQILINKSMYSEAKECLQAAIDLNSNYTKAYYRLGLIEKQLKNYNAALEMFDKALKLEPTNKASIKECDEIKKKLGIDKLISKSNELKITNNNKLINKNDFKDLNNKSNNISNQINSNKSPNLNKNILSNKDFKNLVLPKLDPITIPNQLPKNAYQFDLFWKEAKDSTIKIEYLNFIGSDHFLKLFKNNIEPVFLSELIVLFKLMDKNLVFKFLDSLTKINDFDFLFMFLTDDQKKDLTEIINSLDVNPTELNRLIKLYKI